MILHGWIAVCCSMGNTAVWTRFFRQVEAALHSAGRVTSSSARTSPKSAILPSNKQKMAVVTTAIFQ
jgi:hypothetical protein